MNKNISDHRDFIRIYEMINEARGKVFQQVNHTLKTVSTADRNINFIGLKEEVIND